MERYML